MTSVYVDRRLLSVDGARDGRSVAPAAADALSHLADAGHDVTIVDAVPPARPPHDACRASATPRAAVLDGWLLTSDRADCSEARRRGLRTMLVGPHLESRRPTDRCDEEARDLGAAVLGIMATDAMGPR